VYKALDLWLPACLRQRPRPPVAGVTDVMLCVCDHFEPFHATDKRGALQRLALWRREFPRLIAPFRDADGQCPRHTFFYPIEQYDPDVLSELTTLCDESGGETEIHLHHDRDNAANLAATLERGKQQFASHNLLSRDATGRIRYCCVHGNWALDDSHPEGRGCGVRNELEILNATGCYADFTMPSAPHPTQTRTINSLYYATDTPAPKSHDTGQPVRAHHTQGGGKASLPVTGKGDLLLVQGPLGLNWERRKWGVLPRIENGDLTGNHPPTPDRLRVWQRLGIHVQGRPEWIFIKLHTHGAIPQNSGMLLGDAMRRFHEHLQSAANDGRHWRLHYVTAREMVNILHAAEDGHTSNPGAFRNYRYTLNQKP
jgi:hypothetical protein